MEFTAYGVREQINRVKYRLPSAEQLANLLISQNFNVMQVAASKQADFVTGDMQSYLRFLRSAGIRTILFSSVFYTQEELDDRFTLEDNDKTLFARYGMYGTDRRRIDRSRTYGNSDYAVYLTYSKFVRRNLDLGHPKEMRLYAVHQGKIIACQLADPWIDRIGLLDKAALRKYALENNVGSGGLPFQFNG